MIEQLVDESSANEVKKSLEWTSPNGISMHNVCALRWQGRSNDGHQFLNNSAGTTRQPHEHDESTEGTLISGIAHYASDIIA